MSFFCGRDGCVWYKYSTERVYSGTSRAEGISTRISGSSCRFSHQPSEYLTASADALSL